MVGCCGRDNMVRFLDPLVLYVRLNSVRLFASSYSDRHAIRIMDLLSVPLDALSICPVDASIGIVQIRYYLTVLVDIPLSLSDSRV